ncbi:Zn(2)-C6 fungal-type DNA-binding domain protein [Kalmanozyma brasiliensis GHG001]|nr:Zn(2)-C6 fungal-type DNA-binding domain protein [Kalmanozyma brasiliensis GHG001]EST08153.2 Zn(2)-C6 fungal-type DNA-binding domain protein [Kalmanozyma brasiliensis GHG001]
MDALRGNRKVLPNYLLDDFVPSPDSKASSDLGSQPLTASQSAQQIFDNGNGASNGSTNAGDVSDGSISPFGLLPRRKKKLRQACVYCRRSHLVCEEKRPCHRCVKRGIADRCVDPPQDGQASQDNGWSNAVETGSVASSSKEAFVSPPPQHPSSVSAAGRSTGMASSLSAPGEPSEAERGQQRKRKTRSDAARISKGQNQLFNQEDTQPDYKPPQGAVEYATAETTYAQGPPHPNVRARTEGSTLEGMPGQSAPSYTSIPSSTPIRANSATAARTSPSQLLQVQPIFQPPSSAELDSLFSTYFFDVADAFHPRPNGAHPQGPPPSHPSGHPPLPFSQQQGHLPPDGRAFDGMPRADLHTAHGIRVGSAVPIGPSSDGFQQAHPAPMLQQQQQPRPTRSTGVSHPLAMATQSGGANPATQHATPPHMQIRTMDGIPRQQTNHPPEMSEGKESQLRQRPGDVYAPYPYRKGYASLMRYMTEQDWSEQSIRSVEAALSKIRQLWFSLEDNIQPSSMIQLQAEWAGNVRYYSESVIPFTPVPMVVCRKAGEVYASNQLAQELCGRSREQMTGGKISVYELMTEASASMFFRLYELAVGGTQAEDGTYIPSVGKTAPLYWNAEIVQLSADGSRTVIPARGIFEMKIAPCGLPSLVVCCFVRLS